MTTYTESYGDAVAVEARSGSVFGGWLRLLFGFMLTIAAGLVLAGTFVYGLAQAHSGRMMPGVSVAGIPVAGLDRHAAELKLRESLPSLSAGALHLDAGDAERIIPYAALQRDYQLDVMLADAYTVGRAGTPIEQVADQLRSLAAGTQIVPRYSFDAATLRAAVEAEAAALDRPAVDAAATLGADGRYTVTPGVDGRVMDRQAAVRAAIAAVDGLRTEDATISLQAQPIAPRVTTEQVQAVVARSEQMSGADLVLEGGAGPLTIPAATLRTWLSLRQTPDGNYETVLDPARVSEAVAPLAAQVQRRPVNAGFITKGLKIVRIRPGSPGRMLDVPATERRIAAALTARAAGGAPSPVQLAITPVEAELSNKEARALVPKMREISSWSTYYQVSEKNFFGKNITTPTRVIDGYLLMPGQWFDFWAVVGEVSVETGYGAGGAIINGRTEPTGALAGGICSCSTTIFNAALRAGLEMGDRRNHYYYINRYPVGLDATVFKSSSGSNQNMTFRNDTPYPILVRGINGTGIVTFKLFSVPTGRTVDFSNPIVRNQKQAIDSVEYTDTLPPGQRKRIEVPTDGFDAWVTRWVRDASGRLIHEETYFSRYATIKGVVLVGR